MIDRVSFRAVYERFPAAIKGAFVLRGADGEPHQVRIDMAWVRECAGRSSNRLGVEPATLEVAPTLDTFVPFEVSILDMDPGWYVLELDTAVDGIDGTVQPGERFCIGWPRGWVRRGSVDVDRPLGEAMLRTVECAGDSMRITYDAPAAPTVRLALDGASHAVLEIVHDDGASAGRIIAYPAMREQGVLAISAKGEEPVEVRLP